MKKHYVLCMFVGLSMMLLATMASAAESKSMPVCVYYPQELPSGVPPASIKVYNDFSSDDAINTATAATAITSAIASCFGVPAAVTTATVGGAMIGTATIVRDYIRKNTNIEDLAIDMYLNPIPSTLPCSLNVPNVKDGCAIWRFGLPGGAGVNLLYYNEWDYIKKKSCCDVEACNTITGVNNCIDTWNRNGVPLSMVTQCINRWVSH